MTIDEKKKALEEEINALKSELDESLNSVSREVEHSFEPKQLIKKHPLKALGVSVLAGFLISYRAKASTNSSSVMSSLKKEIGSRAISYLLDSMTNKSVKKD